MFVQLRNLRATIRESYTRAANLTWRRIVEQVLCFE